MTWEPRFNHFEDCLPDDDPRAYDCLYCQDCKHMVHAGNNETMMTWLDTGIGAVCLGCVWKRHESKIDPLTFHWSFDDLSYKQVQQ